MSPLIHRPEDPPYRDMPKAERRWVRAHAWAGVITGLLATAPTSIAEFAVVPTALVFLPRIPWTYHCWRHMWKRPLGAALLLFAAWTALALLWSPDTDLGLEQFGALRFFLVVLFLAPAARLTPWGRLHLIVALAAGVAIGNIVQLLHAWAALGTGPEMFDFGRTTARISGWWDPAVAGTILTAALGLHLPAALMGTGKARSIALAAAAITIAALIATGSRGGWIASAALVAITAAVAVVRAFRTGRNRRPTLIALAALTLIATIGGFAFKDLIAARIQTATHGLTAAVEGDLNTTDGARFAMKTTATQAFLSSPIAGVGTGGFSHWVRDHRPEQANVVHDHAHDTVLHTAATTGLVGVALLIAVAAAAIKQAIAWTRNAPVQPGLGTYQAGPLFALIGLALVTPFDTLHVSASAAAVTGVILALCANPPPDPTTTDPGHAIPTNTITRDRRP